MWSLDDAARRLRLEDELVSCRDDDRAYAIVLTLTGSEEEAEDYLYQRVAARERANVMKATHGHKD